MQNVRSIQGIPDELSIEEVRSLLLSSTRLCMGREGTIEADTPRRIYSLGPVRIPQPQLDCRDNASFVYLMLVGERVSLVSLFYELGEGKWQAYNWDLTSTVRPDYERRGTWGEFNTMFRAALHTIDNHPWILSEDLTSHLESLERIA